MRNIYKGYQQPPTKPYVFPTADLNQGGEYDLLDPALAAELKALEQEENGFFGMQFEQAEATVHPEEVESWSEEGEAEVDETFHVQEEEEFEPETEPTPPPQTSGPSPIELAQEQADAILSEARAVADEILSNIEIEAMDELESLRSVARDEGYRDGYARGMMDAQEQSKEENEAFAEQITQELQAFMESTSQDRDKMIDDTVEELRDLAIAVAEKVVRISLKSSSEVIVRMIQSATDKLKRREWVHIYISGCDSKGLAEISPALSASLSALSDHIKIIPMQDDEIGTCIIETPEEIIDASLSTQVSNIKNIVFDQSSVEM